MKDIKTFIKDSLLQSKQMGKRENKVINMEGRIHFDLLQVIRLNHLSKLKPVKFHTLADFT